MLPELGARPSIYLLRFIFSRKGSINGRVVPIEAKWLETGDLGGGAFRAGFFSGLALGHDGRPKPGSQVFREFVELGITIDLNCLLGGVGDNVAVVAPSQVLFEFGLCAAS